MRKAALLAVGGGALSGAAVLVALGGSPLGVMLVYLAPLPLLAVGLGLGSSPFGFAAAGGLAVAIAFGGFTVAGIFGGMHVFPSWLVVQQALRPSASSPDGWRPIGSILAALTLFIAFVVTTTAWAGRGDEGIEGEVRQLLGAVAGIAAPGLPDIERDALIDNMTPFFLGFSAVTWLLMIIVNAGFAQSLLASRGWSKRPKPEWSQVRLPGWFDWVLVGTAAAALVSHGDMGFLARNMEMVLLTPYFLVGLAVAHVVARRSTMPGLMLAAFYVVLIVFFLLGAALVAVLGIVEQWIGVRGRLNVVPPNRSE